MIVLLILIINPIVIGLSILLLVLGGSGSVVSIMLATLPFMPLEKFITAKILTLSHAVLAFGALFAVALNVGKQMLHLDQYAPFSFLLIFIVGVLNTAFYRVSSRERRTAR